MKKTLLAFVALLTFLSCNPLWGQDTLAVADTAMAPELVPAPDSVISEAMKYLGTPYRWAGKSPKGFDCAGFTRYVYSKFGHTLAPSAMGQYRACERVEEGPLKVGDLVFYGGRKHTKTVGHVGIVTEVYEDGSFRFIHSSTTLGVCLTWSKEQYYVKRYIGACRIIKEAVAEVEDDGDAEP